MQIILGTQDLEFLKGGLCGEPSLPGVLNGQSHTPGIQLLHSWNNPCHLLTGLVWPSHSLIPTHLFSMSSYRILQQTLFSNKMD